MVPPVPTPETRTSIFAACLFPDFRASRLKVDLWVSRVFELLRYEVFRIRRSKTLRLFDGPFHPLGPGRKDEVGAKDRQDLPSLDGKGFRHGNIQFVPPRSSHKSQSNAGIAACRLDDFHTRPEATTPLSRPDHAGPDAAFDRIGWVSAFHFA